MRLESVKKVALLGVGFMGGSLALSLKKTFPGMTVWGYARSQKSYRKLKQLDILDRVEKDLEKAVKSADLIILALPVEAIIDYLRRVSPFLKKEAIVFDLGSSKKLIEEAAKKYLPASVQFVGCHPLCGSEKSGAEFSRVDLYRGSLCLITSPASKPASKLVAGLWKNIGCKVVFISPRRHDEILSCVSHLPHLISFSLTEFVPQKFSRFASGSLKDLTRISNSPAWVWVDIFLSNKKNILKDLKKFIKILQRYKSALEAADKNSLSSSIAKANLKQKQIV